MEGYEKFKEQILKKTKLDLSLYKERQMKRRIESLITRHGLTSFEAYYKKLDTDKVIFDEFVNYLTINVSEFYRNPGQWETLRQEVFPEILKRNKRPKIWSAACSTGEEPYSLVMCLSEFLPLKDIKILAVDFDEEALRKAQIGMYNEKSVKNVPKAYVDKFFEQVGKGYRIKDEVKKCVEFKKMNLLRDTYPKGYDMIVCRNVMIYFTEEAKDEMYKNFYSALVPGGYFFVGSTEQIIQPQRYNFESNKTFFYYKA
ncbi:CheR family methyltransferase [Fusibacter sp. JL298sf-3]